MDPPGRGDADDPLFRIGFAHVPRGGGVVAVGGQQIDGIDPVRRHIVRHRQGQVDVALLLRGRAPDIAAGAAVFAVDDEMAHQASHPAGPQRRLIAEQGLHPRAGLGLVGADPDHAGETLRRIDQAPPQGLQVQPQPFAPLLVQQGVEKVVAVHIEDRPALQERRRQIAGAERPQGAVRHADASPMLTPATPHRLLTAGPHPSTAP